MSAKLPELRNEEFLKKADLYLTNEEKGSLTVYVEAGGMPISPNAASGLYELFLNGSTTMDIWKMNRSIAYGAIVEARIRFNWDEQKELYGSELHSKIRDKVVKAQLEMTSLLSDVMAVANKKHSEKLRKFLQSGDEKHLEGTISVDSIMGMQKIIESMMKITGQDKPNKEEKRLVDIQSAPSQSRSVEGTVKDPTKPDAPADKTELSPEEAAQVLKIMSNLRKKNGK
jgi:hypothetical protein